ncbi:hypothetical protein EDD36DRAFT_417533 [Exophiala viscosa]|uniref:Uncharacterized protein n=1 Tax=Exophiala viscosa TaxID=2486360 RepID=A0AAN6DY18_9EURO|nr:hypothetical protein EDD36DRAFT_417533 [Exophiala viscosa]
MRGRQRRARYQSMPRVRYMFSEASLTATEKEWNSGEVEGQVKVRGSHNDSEVEVKDSGEVKRKVNGSQLKSESRRIVQMDSVDNEPVSAAAMESPSSDLPREEGRQGKKAVGDQLQDLAFNIFGKAIEDKSGERDEHQVIIARNPSSSHWNDLIKQNQTSGAQGPPIFRPSMNFTLREQSTDSALQPGAARFLVVGYAKPSLDKKYKSMDGITKQVVGVHGPKNELCTPYVLAKDDFFYRHEYRNTEKNVKARRSSWSKKIAQHSAQVGRRMPASVGEVIVEPCEGCGNDMKKLLAKADADIAYRPLRSNTALRAFVDAEAVDFEEETAAEVLQEVATLWPDIEGMPAERVLVLNQLMARHDAEIKKFQLKGLLAEGMHRLGLQVDYLSIMDEEGFVKNLVANLDRILGKEAQRKPTASNIDETS